jgi:stearoyl-CoA desaturase (delta-9 desaturase)
MRPISEHSQKIIVPLHAIFLVGLFFFFQWDMLIWTLLGYFLFNGLGIAVGAHRYFSHYTFTTNKFWHYVLGYLSCLGAQGSPIFWAALHRAKHHPHADTDEDPHSPINGKWHSYMGWTLYLDPASVPMRAAKDLIKDRYLLFLHKHYYKVVWLSVLGFFVINMTWAYHFAILAMILSIHQENIINTFCHQKTLGYRNFETSDNSTNITWMGLLFWGQGYHNNHHYKPWDYNFAHKKSEFDICKYVVETIKTNKYDVTEVKNES